ncbi:MAG TPA: aminopeptidase [Oscillatoriaceae cyanobacterium]
MGTRFKLTVLALSAALLSGCYVVQQGYGQARLLMSREPVSKVLAAPDTSAQVRHKLEVILAAKAYAEQVIGLRHTSNYESYVPLKRDAVTYVVSAAPKDKLTPYTWWFPIVGSVPYKGYFARKDAVALQESLKAQGYDTILRNVPAFSTLGWLPDPVYSPFLRYDDATLANIVIHETTHATLYLPGQASFNEGFATFVGNVGAQGFLRQRDGADSPEYREAVDAVADNALFTTFIQEVSAELEALYDSHEPESEKLAERETIFAAAKARFARDYAPRMKTDQFRGFDKAPLNNAAMVSYRTYYNRLDRFEAAYVREGKDLRKLVQFFKDQVAKAPDPEAYLDNWLSSS